MNKVKFKSLMDIPVGYEMEYVNNGQVYGYDTGTKIVRKRGAVDGVAAVAFEFPEGELYYLEKEDVRDTSSNFKAMKFRVESPEHSEKIQKALFKLGYKWLTVVSNSVLPNTAKFTNANFLYTEENGEILYGECDRFFDEKAEYQEHSVKEITSYELEQVISPVEQETIELNGKKYKKKDLEEALAKLNPVE